MTIKTAACVVLAVSASVFLGACSNATLPQQNQTDGQSESQSMQSESQNLPREPQNTSEAGALATADAATQSIDLKGVGNARQLGGYVGEGGRKVKDSVLLRSASLAKATEEDIARLKNTYHLAELIDFRMTSETEAAPDPEIEGVKYLHLRIMDEEAIAKKQAELDPKDLEGLDMSDKFDTLKLAMKLGIVGEQMYIDYLSGEQGIESYAKLFEELLALPEDHALLFHCAQGKDRTGLAAMLILSALGVDEQTIIDDYMLTNEFNAELIESERQTLTERGYVGEELHTMMIALDQVDQTLMTNALDWMKEQYGSVTGYITQELGISDEQIETLQEKYLV